MADVQSTTTGGIAASLDKLNVGNARRVIDETRAAMDERVETAATFIRERPIVCLAAALAIGYLVGKIVSH